MYISRYQIQHENDLRSLHATLQGNDDPQELDLIGIYQFVGTAAATYLRLILDGRGNYALYIWMDMGGWFYQTCKGRYYVSGDLLFTPTKHCSWPLGPFWIGREPDSGRRLLTPFGRSITAGGRDVYAQEPYPCVFKCISAIDGKYHFQNSVTLGKHYLVVGVNEANGYLILLNDRGRKRKYPAAMFERIHADFTPMDRLLSRLKQSDRVKLNPPATIAELQEFEKYLGMRLPQDFVQFYLCCNGLEGEWDDIFRMIPLQEIMQYPDLLHGNAFGFAEYLIYSDIWCLLMDPEDPDQYKISNGDPTQGHFVELTTSLPEFLLRYVDGGGVFGENGLYAWADNLSQKGE